MSTRRMMMASTQHVVDGVIQDSWEEIIENINKGYAEKFYSVGDVKELDLGAYGETTAEFAGTNAVLRSDGNAARTTWVLKDVLPWDYPNIAIYPLLPLILNNALLDVTSDDSDTNKVFYPSKGMMAFRLKLYAQATSRIKKPIGGTSAVAYRLKIGDVYADGTLGTSTAHSASYNSFGFCLGADYPEIKKMKKLEPDTISDTWEEIVYNCQNNLAKTKYKIGDCKTIECEGVSFQVEYLGTGLDSRADGGSGPVSTWGSKDVIAKGVWKYGPAGKLGTAWVDSGARLFCQRLLSKLPSTISSNIVTVVKKSNTYNGSNAETFDNIWFPSVSEVETNGLYKDRFSTNSSRIKVDMYGDPFTWALRDYGSLNHRVGYVSTEGDVSSGSKDTYSNTFGFAPFFCL